MEQNDRKDRIGLDVDETQDQAHHESIDRQRRMSVQHGEERRREEQSRYDAVLGPHRLENDARQRNSSNRGAITTSVMIAQKPRP